MDDLDHPAELGAVRGERPTTDEILVPELVGTELAAIGTMDGESQAPEPLGSDAVGDPVEANQQPTVAIGLARCDDELAPVVGGEGRSEREDIRIVDGREHGRLTVQAMGLADAPHHDPVVSR